MKDEIVYKEKYRKPGVKHIKPPVVDSDMECFEAYTIEAGIIERDGQRLEYQIIKAFFKEKDINHDNKRFFKYGCNCIK